MAPRFKTIHGESGYKKLAHLPFNREFSLRNSLVESMKEFGFIQTITLLETDIIDGVKRLYIADGQNRSMAAQYIDMDFYAFIPDYQPQTEEDIVRFVAKLNNLSVPWKHYDYCKAYSSLGNVDYKTLLQFSNKYGLTIPTGAALLGGSTTTKNSRVSNKVKDGTFKIKSQQVAFDTMNLLRRTKKMDARMILAFHRVRLTIDGFDFNVFKRNFEANYELVITGEHDTYVNIFTKFAT